MSIEIQGAKQSPRYEDKIWYWYYGNTFNLSWKLLLKVNGIPMDIKDTDYVTFTFNQCCRTVYTFTCENIIDNTCILDFTQEISKKFRPGDYTFCIDLYEKIDENNIRRTTIGTAEQNRIIVEECY